MSRSKTVMIGYKAHLAFNVPVAANEDGDVNEEALDKMIDLIWESLERAILNKCRGQDLDIELS